MSDPADRVDLYTGHYGRLALDVQTAIRQETYGEDLGQASWITLPEARDFFDRLHLGPGRTALEVACGSGGVTCRLAQETGAACIGIDISPEGIEAAGRRARQAEGLDVSFRIADGSQPLPFEDGSFDAVFCNDSINHLPDRLRVLREWWRVLRPGGRVLYTDPIVVTGQLSNEEIRTRSSVGFFLFTPVGANERLLGEAGFLVEDVRDLTNAVAEVAGRWHEARARRREALAAIEGTDGFEGLQRFLATSRRLAAERRLSRFMYLGVRRD